MGNMKNLKFQLFTIFLCALLIQIVPAQTIDTCYKNVEEKLIPNIETFQDLNPKINEILSLINTDLIKEYLQTLVGLGPRWTGTYGCEKSAEYISNIFQDLGLQTRFQYWKAFGNEYHPRFFESYNVEATKPGLNLTDEKIIIFSAHYDTVRKAPGANDDGSGTVAVMAAAYALSHFEFEHTLKFVTFSGEEEGLLGSHSYAKECNDNNVNILVDIHADMIGRATSSETGRRMGLQYTEDAEWIKNIANQINNDYNMNFQINTGELNRDGHAWSDHFSFVEYGYEAIGCSEGEGDPNMHTPNDDMDNVNLSYLVNTTRIIAATMAYLADTYDTYPQIRIVNPNYGKLYVEGREKFSIKDLKSISINDMWVWTDINYATEPVFRVEFYYDNSLVYTDTEFPFKWHFNRFSLGEHRIKIMAYDKIGRSFRDIIFINILLNK